MLSISTPMGKVIAAAVTVVIVAWMMYNLCCHCHAGTLA